MYSARVNGHTIWLYTMDKAISIDHLSLGGIQGDFLIDDCINYIICQYILFLPPKLLQFKSKLCYCKAATRNFSLFKNFGNMQSTN